MKKIIIPVLFFVAIPIFGQVLTAEEKSLKEYISGQISKYSSNGEGKSHGLKIHFKYPQLWNSLPGEHPHVIRKFSQPSGNVLALITVNLLDEEFKSQDLDVFMTTEGLKMIVPKAGEYISGNPDLKIEGLKAGSVEYSILDKRVDMVYYAHNITYAFFYKKYYVTIQFSVTNTIEETNESVNRRYQKAQPLFYMMFNSIVIDNIWEN